MITTTKIEQVIPKKENVCVVHMKPSKYRDITMQDSILFLNTVMVAEVMIEAIESVKNTAFYKQELKSALTRAQKESEKVIKDEMATIWGLDDKALYNGMKEASELLSRIARSHPHTWKLINGFIDAYNDSPDEFLKRNNLTHLNEDE